MNPIFKYIQRHIWKIIIGVCSLVIIVTIAVWKISAPEPIVASSIRVVIPEGTSVEEAAYIFLKANPDFDAPRFVALGKSKEGYLFPDTYIIGSSTRARAVISMMSENFWTKMRDVDDVLKSAGRPLADIINMASILEKEAMTYEDKRLIAGILWKRMNEGMLLQVDAPFLYDIGKGTYSLTSKDLKTDSAYNTYTNKGLPPTPITNPGLESIKAAADPMPSPYYFYLSDRDGKIYYSRTHDEHVVLKMRYVR